MSQDARYIPWLIVAFFITISAVLGGFVYIAQKTHTGVVTEQAYEKGLQYNKLIEKADLQEKTGYRSSVKKIEEAIVFRLEDQDGNPVKASDIRLWLFRPAHEGMDHIIPMTEKNDGTYAGKISGVEKGLWEVRIKAETPKGPYQTVQRMVFQ